MIRNLIHIILIILLFAAPASCEAESIIIEDAANIGAVDVTLAYDGSYSLQICWQYYKSDGTHRMAAIATDAVVGDSV